MPLDNLVQRVRVLPLPPEEICATFHDKYTDNRVAINETQQPIRNYNSHNSKLSLDYCLWHFRGIFFLINVDNPRLTDFLHAFMAGAPPENIILPIFEHSEWSIVRRENIESWIMIPPFHGCRLCVFSVRRHFFSSFFFLIIPATIGVVNRKKK